MKILKSKPPRGPNAKHISFPPKKSVEMKDALSGEKGKPTRRRRTSKKEKLREDRQEEQDVFLLFLEKEKEEKEKEKINS
jgi:hypothetical protein